MNKYADAITELEELKEQFSCMAVLHLHSRFCDITASKDKVSMPYVI